MKALVYRGRHSLNIEETDDPEPEVGEALIRVAYAGICGSDLSIYNGEHPRARPGLIMGHEFSGTVEKVNTSDKGLQSGERVVAEPLISCGDCFACRSGFAYVCQNLKLYGIDAPGAFAEYVKLPVEKVCKVPRTISLPEAVLIEPLAVAVHAVRESSLKTGDFVCVLGGGPIGLLTALVARESGAREVVISEVRDYRLQLAEEFGFQTLDAGRTDVSDEVRRLTDGRGADIVYEAAGFPESMLLAPRLCRVRGELILISMPKQPREMDIVAITFSEITLKGIRVYAPYDFNRAIDLLSKRKFKLGKLHSEPFLLEEAVKAFAMAQEGKKAMKVIFGIKSL
jgi:2-desacetyl-2-hydroxyethyl bacteriochlorophyllide A dehydrogenase